MFFEKRWWQKVVQFVQFQCNFNTILTTKLQEETNVLTAWDWELRHADQWKESEVNIYLFAPNGPKLRKPAVFGSANFFLRATPFGQKKKSGSVSRL